MTRRIGKRPFSAAAVLLLTLGACSQSSNSFNAAKPIGGLDMPIDVAVAHNFTLSAPNAQLEAIQQRHMSECRKLGCSILSTSISQSDGGPIKVHALVRVKRDSYDAFAAALAAPPATVTFHSETTNDL